MSEELKIVIKAEIDNIKKNLNNAKKQLQSFGKKAKQNLKEVSKAAQDFGDKCAKGLKVVGTAVIGAGAALMALSVSTEEYRRNQAKLTTAFETAGGSANDAKTVYNDLYRVLGDDGQAVEAASHLAQLTTNQQSLSDWTLICQGAYATFGDSLPIESLTEAANETAKTGELTGGLADALNWAGVSEAAFAEQLALCNDEAEREALIRETLKGLYGDAALLYEENAAQMLAYNEAQARLQEATAAVGEAMTPVNTAFTNFAATILEILTPYIDDFVENHLPQLEEILDDVADVISDIFTWISDNIELLTTLATVVLAVMAAFAAYSATMKVVDAVMTVFSSPVNMVVMGIMLIIAAIVLCIIYWDEIKATVINVWDAIVTWITEAKDKVVEKVKSMVDSVKTWFENMKTSIQLKWTLIKLKAVEIWENIKESIKEKIDTLKENISTKIESIRTTITTKFTLAKLKVVSIFTDIKDSIKEKIEDAKDAVSDVIDTIKDVLGLDDFEWELPKPKLPHFSVSGGEAPWGFLGEGSLPKITVDWYAKGGVFDAATLFAYGQGSIGGLGEKGAEAIVPLENNLGWLDKMAEMLQQRLNHNNTPIVLQVDGKVFAQTTIESLNKWVRQTGSLPLNII